MLPNSPTVRDTKVAAAADLVNALRQAHSTVALRRIQGIGDAAPAKLSWWDTATTPVKVAVVGGGVLVVVGAIAGAMALMKKGRRR